MPIFSKKQSLDKALKIANLDSVLNIIKEDTEEIIYMGSEYVLDKNCTIFLKISNEDFNIITIAAPKPMHKTHSLLLEILNDLNKENTLMSFFLDGAAICARINYIANEKEFDALYYVDLATSCFQFFGEEYVSKVLDY